ncbi:MAG TPA: DUF167 domain-containing protein [Candidatus Cybelea sp.]|nr:DUF167 domain-containing protein [Candidatus Cybelea sp.]
MSSSAEAGWYRAVEGGVRLRLKVQPKARRQRIDGLAPDPEGVALRVAVAAPPEDGKANAAVIALLADELGVAKAAISVVNGAADRRKLVEIRGNSKVLGAALAALAGAER